MKWNALTYRWIRERVRDQAPAGARVLLAGERTKWRGEPEARLLPWLVEKGTIAIDVGANVGAYSYLLGRLVGRGGAVVSIEPIEELADIVQRGSEQLRLPTRVYRLACSSLAGEARLSIPKSDGRAVTMLARLENRADLPDGESRTVQTSTLDEIVSNVSLSHRRISFVKIDTEGHEYEVLQGAMGILGRDRPNLMVEIEHRHSARPIQDTFELLSELNYLGLYLDKDRQLRPLQTFDPKRDQLHANEGAYINNFVFLYAGQGAGSRS